MNRVEMLEEILNKTIYLTSAIESEELEIIANLLDERETLMKMVDENREAKSEQSQALMNQIATVDTKNQELFKVLEEKIRLQGNNIKQERNKIVKSSKVSRKYIQGNEILESSFNKTR